MRNTAILAISMLLGGAFSPAQNIRETLLSDENAYNPIPSPDVKLLAYVQTGRRGGIIGGVGRSSPRSEVPVMTITGDVVSRTPLVESLVFG